jgi:hypothetical protein
MPSSPTASLIRSRSIRWCSVSGSAMADRSPWGRTVERGEAAAVKNARDTWVLTCADRKGSPCRADPGLELVAPFASTRSSESSGPRATMSKPRRLV